MDNKSKYDKLHDKYNTLLTQKSGTRYERLAAFVFKTLEKSDVVIHDLKLIGDTGVKHQIDVIIEKNCKKRRTLIECKDFEISGNKVGLGIARNFWAVIDDIEPDEAIIITSNEFTKPARKYAKGKNIKLAILRKFEDKDWQGRIKQINVTMHIFSITEPKVELGLFNQLDSDKLKNDLKNIGLSGNIIWKKQPVFLNTPDGRYQINEFVENKSNSYPRDNEGPVELKIKFKDSTIEIENKGGIPIKEMILKFEIYHSEKYFEVTSDKIAELIINGLYEDDIIIFDEDLKRLKIDDETGEILLNDNA
ncbi:MAG: restriction endonuclease [Candidatus Cloacimonetes bacterium]|nr:restriction endonuclease [Candidatus Cloacimonadota bacterium]